MADFAGEADLDGFRAEARAWLEANYPPSLRNQAPQMRGEGRVRPEGDSKLWLDRVREKGWGAPTAAVEFGGAGLSAEQARVVQEELSRAGIVLPQAARPGMVGSTLLEFGTDDQKRRFMPKILRGEIGICLGYSEPGSGSDLASLSTKAEDAGDHYVINGQKIWTSGAADADWIACLCRTDPRAKKHDGISLILVDMRQPGIEARRIRLTDGSAGFCEVFIKDARAEKENVLGPLNGGWTVGKKLLQYERVGQSGAAGTAWADTTEPLEKLAARVIGLNPDGRLSDPDLRARLTTHLIDAHAHRLTLARAAAEGGAGGDTASVIKNSASLVGKEKAELTVEILGSRGISAIPNIGGGPEGFTEDEVGTSQRLYWSKAQSIVGGTFEVQYNVISKRVLGLPDMTKAS